MIQIDRNSPRFLQYTIFPENIFHLFLICIGLYVIAYPCPYCGFCYFLIWRSLGYFLSFRTSFKEEEEKSRRQVFTLDYILCWK